MATSMEEFDKAGQVAVSQLMEITTCRNIFNKSMFSVPRNCYHGFQTDLKWP